MAYVNKVLLLVGLMMIVSQTINAQFDEDEGETRRALGLLEEILEERSMEERGLCKKSGEKCRSLPKCCGTLHCVWKDGYSMIKPGKCVTCVNKGSVCHQDKHCCGKGDLQCDKSHRLNPNGICNIYRRSGKCYRDGQCVNKCNKKWYQLSGKCI